MVSNLGNNTTMCERDEPATFASDVISMSFRGQQRWHNMYWNSSVFYNAVDLKNKTKKQVSTTCWSSKKKVMLSYVCDIHKLSNDVCAVFVGLFLEDFCGHPHTPLSKLVKTRSLLSFCIRKRQGTMLNRSAISMKFGHCSGLEKAFLRNSVVSIDFSMSWSIRVSCIDNQQ